MPYSSPVTALRISRTACSSAACALARSSSHARRASTGTRTTPPSRTCGSCGKSCRNVRSATPNAAAASRGRRDNRSESGSRRSEAPQLGQRDPSRPPPDRRTPIRSCSISSYNLMPSCTRSATMVNNTDTLRFDPAQNISTPDARPPSDSVARKVALKNGTTHLAHTDPQLVSRARDRDQLGRNRVRLPIILDRFTHRFSRCSPCSPRSSSGSTGSSC